MSDTPPTYNNAGRMNLKLDGSGRWISAEAYQLLEAELAMVLKHRDEGWDRFRELRREIAKARYPNLTGEVTPMDATPRTDAAVGKQYQDRPEWVDASFARLLERELAAKEKTIQALLDHCPDAECRTCGRAVCPQGEWLHFHHDGCPACAK